MLGKPLDSVIQLLNYWGQGFPIGDCNTYIHYIDKIEPFKTLVFLGVLETIVRWCLLLCCGVGSVCCLFNLLYDIMW